MSVCLSGCRSACISTVSHSPISVKFDVRDFCGNIFKKSRRGYNGTDISGAVHEDEGFVVAGDIKLPLRLSLQVKWYNAIG